MKRLALSIQDEIGKTVSRLFYVAVAYLDDQILYLSDRPGTLAGASFLPGVLSWGEFGSEKTDFRLNKNVLGTDSFFWIGREIKIYEIIDDLKSVLDGNLMFDGVFETQPVEIGDELRFSLAPKRLYPAYVPSGVVGEDGSYVPVIYGTVEKAKLLASSTQPVTRLTDKAEVGDKHLFVADASLFDDSGTVVLDGVSYSYTSRDETGFFGVVVTQPHYEGTVLAGAGDFVYVAAEHAVASISNIRSDDYLIAGGTVNLSNATVEFSGPPMVIESQSVQNVEIHFDAVDASSTALNGINAIVAATGTQNQSASSLPTDVTSTNKDEIVFVRPTAQGGTNRIISAVYTISADVSVTPGAPAVGRAYVVVGGKIIWAWEAGQVIFNDTSSVAVAYHKDTDYLPVRIELDGANPESFSVDVTAAQRDVVVGNLDSAAFAVLRKSSNTDLIVNQTTENPVRGLIDRVQLVVEFFTTASNIDQVDVFWDGDQIGSLSAVSLVDSGQSVHSVVIDTVSSGSAVLSDTSIDHSLTSGVSRTDNAISVPINVPVGYTPRSVSGAPTQTFVYALDLEIPLPPNVVGGTYNFTVYQQDAGQGSNSASEAALDGVSFTPNGSSQVVAVTLSDNQTSMTLEHDVDLSSPTGYFSTYVRPSIRYVTGTIQAKPTDGAISISGATPTGTSDVHDGTVDVSGVSSAADIDGTGTGTLTVTFPPPVRTVVNAFDLSQIDDWDDLTDKQAKLIFGGSGTEDISVVRIYLAVDFLPSIQKYVSPLYADVTGKSGNPADVLKDLAQTAGQNVCVESWRRLKNWADQHDFVFSRRVSDLTDSARLLRLAADQSNVMMADSCDGLSFVRYLDLNYPVFTVQESDLLNPYQIQWSSFEDVHNDVSVRFNQGKNIVSRDKDTPDSYARLGFEQIKQERRVEFDAQWISDATTAGIFLKDYVWLNGSLVRYLNIDLPYSFEEIEVGDFVQFTPLSALFRVVSLRKKNGWIGLSCREFIEIS